MKSPTPGVPGKDYEMHGTMEQVAQEFCSFCNTMEEFAASDEFKDSPIARAMFLTTAANLSCLLMSTSGIERVAVRLEDIADKLVGISNRIEDHG